MTAHKVPAVSLLFLTLSLLPQVAQGVSPTTLTLAVSPNPSTFGAPVTLTATVNPASATGNVTFYDGVTVLGTKSLSSGAASFLTGLLPSGARTLKAYYAGDASYGPATSNTVPRVVHAVPGNAFAMVRAPREATSDGSVLGVADFDLDGTPDMLVAFPDATLNLVKGSGTAVRVSANRRRLVVGDFNADGKPDLAMHDDNGVSILLGNGDGTFQTGVVYPAGFSAGENFTLVLGDFNGDGKADLAVHNGSAGHILLGKGDGSFQAPLRNVLAPSGSLAVEDFLAVADWNQDGRADVVILSYQDKVSVQFGNGDGTFQSPVVIYSSPSTSAMAVGDFNGDGNADLAIGNDDHISVLPGNGDGTFGQPIHYPAVSSQRLRAGDFNGDGRTDLLAGGILLVGVEATLTATGGTPQSVLTGRAFPTALQATAKDSNGDPVSGVTVTFTAPVGGAGATLSSATAVTDAAGVASVTATANQTAGNYDVTATTGALTPATFSLTNTDIAGITATGGTPQFASASSAFPAALEATVTDTLGNPVSGVTVTFAAPSAGAGATAILSSTTASTNASGIASVTATATNLPGSYSVTATIGAFSTSFSLTNAAPPASITAGGGTPQSATAGNAFPAPLQAIVLDSAGRPVGGVPVTFTAPALGPSATLAHATVMTDGSGVASVTATAGGVLGSYTVTATYPWAPHIGPSPTASFSLTNTAGDPSSLATAGGTPQSAAVSAPFATALQALVKDSFGNPLSGATVTFTAPSSGASATLSSATAFTNDSGLALVTAVANSTTGTYNVTATIGALSATFALTNTAAPVGSVTATVGTPQTTVISTAFASALQATVKDTAGNGVSGITVTFAAPSSGASAVLSSTTALTNVSGVASITATANATAGAYNVTASVGALSATFALTNLSAEIATVTASGGAGQSAVIGAAFATALQATVKDSGGNPISGVTVTFAAPAITSASAVLSATTAVTNASGIASVTATANSIAGAYNVTASAGAASATFALTNTVGPAASLTATGGTPQSAVVGVAFTNPLQATVKDSGGNPISGVTVTFAAPVSGASATLSGNSAVTNASGVASITVTANSTAGGYSVMAIAGALSTTFSLTNTSAAPATLTATGGTPQSTVAGMPFQTALQATVKDSGGNGISGVTVTFTAPSSGASATLSSATASTNASGVATVSAIANGTIGTYDVTATVGALTPVTFALTNTAGQVASVTATAGTPQSTLVSTAFPTGLQVTVKNSGGTPLNGVTVTFNVPTVGPSAGLSAATATTNASGVAVVTATANSTAGSYFVTATAGGFTATFTLSNTTAVPASVTPFGGTPQTTTTGLPFQNALQAIVKDASGNPISGVNVTFAAPSSGASATLSSATALTNASGVASVSAIANSVTGSYTVSASVGALSTSFSLTNQSTTPASITATGGTPQSTAAGTNFAVALQATVKDAAGHAVSGVTVTFSAPTSGASAMLSSATAVTNSSGVASITASANGTTGSYNVTATVGALSATFALSNSSAPPAGIAASGGTPQSAAVGTAFVTPLQATVKDGSGNPVSGVTVTFAAPTTGASATLSSPSAVTNASGVAGITATANNTAGTYNVTAIASSFSATFSLTNTGGGASTLTATAGVTQTAVMGTAFFSALRVMVRDGNGIPVSGVTVKFAAPSTGASATLSSTTAATNSGGVASVTATANAIPGSYTVTATVGEMSATFWLTNMAGPAASITSTRGTPQSAALGAAFAVPLQVTVRDSLGNPVSGASIFFTVPTSGASATVSSGMASTNTQGVASVIATANSVAGSYVVTATVDALSTLFALTNIGSGGSSNLALGKIATQSSTLPGFPSAAAASAVDGISNGSFYGGSVTATNLETNPWWQVDLGAAATVNSVVIFNRTDCCGTRLNDYWLFISNTPFLATDTPATLQNRAGTYSSHQTTAPGPSATIDTGGAQGRYLRVQLNGTDYLSLAEVQVVGTGGGASFSNLSVGKTASQSSTLAGYTGSGAGSAVDSNTDGSFFSGSVTATNMEANPWWQVDLGASAAVSSVVVWNRTDCCASRLNDYWIFVSDTPFLATDTPATLESRAGTYSSHQLSAPDGSVNISTAGAQGRYVRIQLTGSNYLSLAEVQVMGTGGFTQGSTNVAQGKTATQSSTLPGVASAAPASAVDGNTDGGFYNGSVTATNLENSPWWQVDLGASKAVSLVVLWNRTDCCGGRLGDYWVFVSDTPFLATDTPATLESRAGTFSSHEIAAPAPSTSVTVASQGRYVRVQLNGQNYLSLAEVQVLGH